MKKILLYLCLFLLSLSLINCRSGLVTTSNSCYNSIQSGEASNKTGNYSAALDQFNQVLQKCDAYDAKEKAYAGKATALNGLGQYSDALAAANEGIKISSTGVDNVFQRASAELGLGMQAEAKADFAKVIDMTTKNRNVKDRATIYAKIAELDVRQSMYSDAMNNIDTAISLDNSNSDFHILKGDIYAGQNDYISALAAYKQAVAVGGNSAKVWQARVEAETKAFQKKYGTGSNAADLSGKISPEDKQILCSDISSAKSNGVKVQNIDLLQLSICK